MIEIVCHGVGQTPYCVQYLHVNQLFAHLSAFSDLPQQTQVGSRPALSFAKRGGAAIYDDRYEPEDQRTY